jgi:hypothetical protein
MAYKSRSKRASEVASNYRDVAETIRGYANVDGDKISGEEKQKIVDDVNSKLEELDFGEIEALKDEMCSWRDNMEGTNLENTSKYEEVSECADALEDIEAESKSVEEWDGIEDVAEELDEIADNLENLNFPGMY